MLVKIMNLVIEIKFYFIMDNKIKTLNKKNLNMKLKIEQKMFL